MKTAMMYLKVTVSVVLVLSMAVPGALAHEYKSRHLVIEHPHMTGPIPGAKVSAGYVVITNTGAAPERLVAVFARFAEKTQIHSVHIVDGVARMRPLKDGIDIAPGKSAVLKKGGNHLMFVNVSDEIEIGQLVPVRMMFQNAGHVNVEMLVVDPADTDDEEAGETKDHSGHAD